MGYFAVLEFGGQHTDLIGNRVRELGHAIQYVPSNTAVEALKCFDGVILSGGPKSVYERDRYPYNTRLFSSDLNVLGICYGMQLMGDAAGTTVLADGREYGEGRARVLDHHPIFEGLPNEFTVWMNHGDTVRRDDSKFRTLAVSDKNLVAGLAWGNNVGVQFHPELTHTEYGRQIIGNFAEGICKAKPSAQQRRAGFDADSYIRSAMDEIKDSVGKKKGFVYVSGGVDSTAVLKLAREAGVEVIAVHLDMGVERKDEAEMVRRFLKESCRVDVDVLSYGPQTIEAVRMHVDPEMKRRAFKRVYDWTLDDALKRTGVSGDAIVYLDGTIATDKRETGMEAGRDGRDAGTVATIKTHHNPEKREGIEYLEPLRYLSKGEVREVARTLGLPDEIVNRKPFPGPGLVVRMINGIYPCDSGLEDGVSEIAEFHGFRGYVLPIKTVGIKGDSRSFERLALIRGDKDWRSIRAAQKELAEQAAINRTVYAHSSWGEVFAQKDFRDIQRGLEFGGDNIRLLQEATAIVEDAFEEYGVKPMQLPVVAFPVPGGIGIAVRDVDSVDFRSVRPLRKPDEAPWELFDDVSRRLRESPEIRKYGDVKLIVNDVSTKPAATTEWE